MKFFDDLQTRAIHASHPLLPLMHDNNYLFTGNKVGQVGYVLAYISVDIFQNKRKQFLLCKLLLMTSSVHKLIEKLVNQKLSQPLVHGVVISAPQFSRQPSDSKAFRSVCVLTMSLARVYTREIVFFCFEICQRNK